MKTFEEIWPEFDWILDELGSGMAFFEGYIPTVCNSDIEGSLLEFSKPNTVQYSCEPCWSDNSLIPEEVREYSIAECVSLLEDGKLASFDFEYTKDYGRIVSHQKLIFSATTEGTDLMTICFSEWILASENPKDSVQTAIEEMCNICRLFDSDALYIGPDGLDLATDNYLRIL